MRKLTKKISMLMVLAMLVGLFSGVVSASAASKWAFKSNDLDVAVGATVNLDQNQYENFDLYKSGAIADEATYTITWESSDEKVVFVNAKTGQLRAKKDAADGAEAVITANIVNNSTKGTHKVSFTIVVGEVKAPVYTLQAPVFEEAVEIGAELKFSTNVLDEAGKAVSFKECGLYRAYFIDGKAIANPWTAEKSGTYTITVGAFKAKADMADLEKAVDKATFEVVVAAGDEFEVAQVSVKEIKLTFDANKDLSKITKDDIYVGSSATVDGTLYREYISKVEAKDNVLTVVLYNEMVKDQYITVKYAEESAGFKVSKGDVDQVVVADGPVMIGEARKLNIKLYSNGIDVTNDTLLGNVTLEIVAGGENANVVNANQIIFWEAGKTATVKAIYHTYDYATNGDGTERVYTSAPASITSRSRAVSIGNITEWTITNAGVGNWWDIKWNGRNYVTLEDNSFRVVGKLTQTTTTTYDDPQTKRTDEIAGLAYESSNTDVFYVDANGYIYPIKLGSADVIVKDTNNNNAIIGVYRVTVKPKRELVGITASIDKTFISQHDTVTITVTGKDQYGDGIGTGNLNFTNVSTKTALGFTPVAYTTDKYSLSGLGLDSTNGTVYTCEVKTANGTNKTAYVSFTVKTADTNNALYKYGFDADSYTFSTKVDGNTENFSKDIKIATYDKNGNLASTPGSTPIKAILPDANQTTANATVTAGAYYVVVDKPSYVNNNNINSIVTLSNGVVTFNYLMKDVQAQKINKAAAGSYTLKLYKANVIAGNTIGFTLVDSLPITVKDDQLAYAVTVKATETANAAMTFAAVVGSTTGTTLNVNAALKAVLDECYTLKYDNTDLRFANLEYVSVAGVAVNPNISVKEVKVLNNIKIKDGSFWKVEMTINLFNQSIKLK